ncbi:MAG TPA: hypothetical protein VLY03_00680 [Bacteroidota bacterium]|nr:hypothetical protein [Bacteroidota bacterium]
MNAQAAVFSFVRDRGSAILTLGILAILLFGPFTGVPGWLMANQDLRDMRSGILPDSAMGTVRTGRTLSIVGTFCSLLSLFLLFLASVIVFSFVMVFGEMFSAVL